MSKFLRRSLMVFINKGFRTIVFIFIVISTIFGQYVLWPSSEVCCLNFWDESWWFLSFRIFGLLSSSVKIKMKTIVRKPLMIKILSKSTTKQNTPPKKNNNKKQTKKRNTVKNGKWFYATLVSASCTITSSHQMKYLSMTRAKHHPGGHHATLF